MVPESGLRRLVAARVEHERLEELPIPLHVVAVDVVTGEELLLSSGPVVDAVMASAAIPGRSTRRRVGRPRADGRRGRQQHAHLARDRARRP